MDNELDRFLEWVVEMFSEAAVCIDDWGAYASEYQQEKWHLKEEVKKFEDAATLVRKYIKDGK